MRYVSTADAQLDAAGRSFLVYRAFMAGMRSLFDSD